MSCSQLLEPNLPMSRWKPSTSATWLFGFAGHEPGADSLELPEREKPCARGAPCQKRGTFSQLQKDSTRRPVWGCRCSCKLGICACALRKERGRENRERETRHYQTITTWMATSYHVASKSFNTLQQNEEHAKETKPEITFECLVMSA
jgi:hypothetical protein